MVPNKNRVTRTDVARYAGVSTAVVSYVINNGPRPVAPQTAERVRAAIKALNYHPNLNAQSLRRGSSKTLGLALIDSYNPFFLDLMHEVDDAAREQGYRLLTTDLHNRADQEQEFVQDLVNRQVEGLILMGSIQRERELTELLDDAIPTVFLDAPGPITGQNTIGIDAQGGTVAAIEHLTKDHSCKTIALILGTTQSASVDPRELAWHRSIETFNCRSGGIYIGDWSPAGGYQAVQKLLAAGPLPDAIFVSSDAQAIGALAALHDAHLEIPKDCAVIAFDGTRAGQYTWPALTSVHQPTAEMAQKAVQLVTGDKQKPAHYEFPMTLTVRESCGCQSLSMQNSLSQS